MHFKLSSAICFNLDQSKILSFGNGMVGVLRLIHAFLLSDIFSTPPSINIDFVSHSPSHWSGHHASPTVVSLKGRLPQKLQSQSTLPCSDTQSVSSWFYKETEIKI